MTSYRYVIELGFEASNDEMANLVVHAVRSCVQSRGPRGVHVRNESLTEIVQNMLIKREIILE